MFDTDSNLVALAEAKKEIKFLFFNKFWNFEYPDFSKLNLEGVQFFYEKEHLQDADVVVFHIPSLDLIPQELKVLKKEKEQLWIYWSFECELNYPAFQRPEILDLFDITMTYQIDSDIPIPYTTFCKEPQLRQEPAKKTGFVNAFFSSHWDKSGRYDYLAELMSCLNIDSFGKVLNNKKLEEDPYPKQGLIPESFQFKEQVISRYKFTLAFENAIAKDYVTEKFLQPLAYGSVPVYLGAPNVEDFAPGDHCYINVNSFSSVKELADYLILLDNNDDLYLEYFKWKKLPFRTTFESKLNFSSEDMLDRLIALIKKKRIK